MPENANEMDMIIIFRRGLPVERRATTDFLPTIPDIRRSMNGIHYIIRDFGPFIEPDGA